MSAQSKKYRGFTLYIDQYGNRVYANSITELKEKGFHAKGAKVEPIYQDKRDGRTVQTGVVIGDHWYSAYRPFELEPEFDG